MSVSKQEVVSSLREHINPSLLQAVLSFWFSHFTSPHQFVAPSRDAVSPWFMRDENFDRACASKFGPCLDAIRSLHPSVTADDLVSCIDAAESLDWIALVILLDQIPRNVYRGEAARTAFTVFDPLAQAVVRRAVEDAGVFHREDLRGKVAYRCWLVFPLMHSEDGALHERCVAMCEEMVADAKGLESREGDREAATEFAETLLGFERRHRTIVERFGRYPHRNAVLGREGTEEEVSYLRDGGETFGG